MHASTHVEPTGRRKRRRRLASGHRQGLVVAGLCLGKRRSTAAAAAAAVSQPGTAAEAAASRYHQLSGAPPTGAVGTDADGDIYLTSWDSSPFNLETQSTNNLGMLARACSQQFCNAGVNGLDLWVSIQEGCTGVSETRFSVPALLELKGSQTTTTTTTTAAAPIAVSGTTPSGYWSTLGAGALCSLIAGAGLFAGFIFGGEFGLKRKGIDRSSARSSCLG